MSPQGGSTHDSMETARGFLTFPVPRKEATNDRHPGS